MIRAKMPTTEALRERFDYRSDGKLVKRKAQKSWPKGHVVGSQRSNGYVDLNFDGQKLRLHVAIWLWHGNEIPSDMVIDHVDCNPSNNRIENLRLLTNAQNIRRAGIRKQNTSGVTGVSYHKTRKQWQARIKVDGVDYHLGWFVKKDKAVFARKRAEKEMGYHA